MIRIKAIKNDNEIDISLNGHAEYDKYGQDIVCSACSILTFTLGSMIEELYLNNFLEEEPIVDVEEPGNAHIKFTFSKGCDEMLGGVLNFAIMGYNELSQAYPSNVSLEINRGIEQLLISE